MIADHRRGIAGEDARHGLQVADIAIDPRKMTLEHSDTEQVCGRGQLPTLAIDLDDGSMSPID